MVSQIVCHGQECADEVTSTAVAVRCMLLMCNLCATTLFICMRQLAILSAACCADFVI